MDYQIYRETLMISNFLFSSKKIIAKNKIVSEINVHCLFSQNVERRLVNNTLLW